MKVELTDTEMRIAIEVGVARQLSAMVAGKRDVHGASGSGWDLHIEGAAGELAVAKAIGVYYPASVDTYRDEPDLPPDIEVRTRSRQYYDLIVRSDDDPFKRYVLVTGRSPELTVRGWIYGNHAMNPSWVKTYGNRPPAFFVPQTHLNPVEALT